MINSNIIIRCKEIQFGVNTIHTDKERGTDSQNTSRQQICVLKRRRLVFLIYSHLVLNKVLLIPHLPKTP